MTREAGHHLKSLSREDLSDLLSGDLSALLEEEVLAVIDNPFITPQLLARIAQTQRFAALYSVRLKLVAHRQLPQAYAVKFVHYLYWFDLLRLSVDVTVPAPVRRAIDTQLLIRLEKLTLGERVASARRCGAALIKVFVFDPHPKI